MSSTPTAPRNNAANKVVKSRNQWTDEHRRAVRKYYRENDKPSLRAIQDWFFTIYHLRISSSCISEWISARYTRVDNPAARLDQQRAIPSHWPELEEALMDWYTRMFNNGTKVTGEMLSDTARVFWKQMPCYADKASPKFSAGWLDGFKKRHEIRQRSKKESKTAKISDKEGLVRAKELMFYIEQQDRIDPKLVISLNAYILELDGKVREMERLNALHRAMQQTQVQAQLNQQGQAPIPSVQPSAQPEPTDLLMPMHMHMQNNGHPPMQDNMDNDGEHGVQGDVDHDVDPSLQDNMQNSMDFQGTEHDIQL